MRRSIFRALLITLLVLPILYSCRSSDEPTDQVGPNAEGVIVSTRQLIHPAGRSAEYHGRPVDLALAPDGKTVYAKSDFSIIAIDVDSWQVRQEFKYPPKNGASPHGIITSKDGTRLYVTTGQSKLLEVQVGLDGKLAMGREISLLVPAGQKGQTFPCGLALSDDQKAAYVCLSTRNTLAVVDLLDGTVQAEIPVGMAPFGVRLAPGGKTAYVTNWAGRRPRTGDQAAMSDRSAVVIDGHGAAASGTVSVVDLTARAQTDEIETGLHPSDLVLTRDGRTLYVACATSDCVSVIDTASRRVTGQVSVRPQAGLGFGSACDALALSDDQKTLFAAVAGNNAVAVIDLSAAPAQLSVAGFIPAGWYPGALAVRGGQLMIANVKGLGSRDPKASGKWNTRASWGSVSCLDIPDAAALSRYTQQVKADALVPQALKAWEKMRAGVKPVPVPQHIGEPSVFEHVVYVIKENRSYDQVLGDIGKGNSDPSLCIFGKAVTPNQHALAEQFALLDNFYCNGVLSADGHAWATEGVAVDYLEKSFGAWVRSYPFGGDDPMAISPAGFIWDDALLRGLSFRNYGEMVHTSTDPASNAAFGRLLSALAHDNGGAASMPAGIPDYTNELGPKALGPYTHPTYPGWNLNIPDAVRAQVFLSEFNTFRQRNQFPNLTTLYLPDDHTRATVPGAPTPAAMVADNDLAVGRVVEAISHSPFWPTTCIFIIEDDPQNGFDHVDGHRSTCLVISPYTRRGATVSSFYNQTSVLHTMELMLGLPPMNQMDAMAPVMRGCFNARADLAPFVHVANRVPLDQRNPPKAALSGMALELAEESARQPFDEPDRADEDTLNRILWHAQRGTDAAYPAAFAGPHGRGLKALHLTLDGAPVDDD